MKIFIILLVITLVYASIPYQNCGLLIQKKKNYNKNIGSSNDDFQLKSINIIPYPPIRGREAVLIINGTLIKTVFFFAINKLIFYKSIRLVVVICI